MEDEELFQTFEELEQELIEVEEQLGKALQLPHPYRQALIDKDLKNDLIEDEVVQRWQELYCVYTDWLRWRSKNR